MQFTPKCAAPPKSVYTVKEGGEEMRIMLCEDNDVQAALMESYVKSWADENGAHVDFVRFSDAEEFTFRWSSDNTFDLAFLDIGMRGMDGMSLGIIIK
jgi:CheY-like chemotaxis protein